ncbi:MAG: N-acetyltransferase [Candidatus Edwardsbacteria bacterium]|nr:N-acetyltransferase [Candidatus Edwardsbacteria bacterium]MBU1576521.1 N-acetyltransferase [Candidatus Edwardsbacteria bacterium]MBU2464072.1 N-acetyltransferase [Candidatus Edwardsbacteria bacterium]MBU2593870.1 N-acetyltransferase [Candidatus Edwardsbacteria bacterium]
MSDYFVHESAYVDQPAEIGNGTKIWHFSHVSKGAKIGQNCSLGQNVYVGSRVEIGHNCKIQNNVSIYDLVTLEDNVFCGPSMVFTNDMNPRAAFPKGGKWIPTLVKTGASLGANCTIVCGYTIGKHAFVAAGSVARFDVPDYAIVAGVPARIIGWMCECGGRLDFSKAAECACGPCQRKYQKKCDNLVEKIQ